MKEFNYDLDYSSIDFTKAENRYLYRIGRGEQGVTLVAPYTNIIGQHWRFKDVKTAWKSSLKIYNMFVEYMNEGDFIGMDMCRKFLEMGFTRARRYANHADGRKYDAKGNVKPQEKDALTSEKAISARIFRQMRNEVTNDPVYKSMREEWRALENK